MALVHLIRHGQASFGADNYDVLSPTGHLQGKIVGDELRRRSTNPDHVYSGTLQRQRDTATAAGFPTATEDARWNEYDHLSLVQNAAPTTPREFQLTLDAALRNWIGGTDWQDFTTRVHSALDTLLTDLGSGGSALVFTSGGVIAAVCAKLLGLPPEGFLAVNRVTANASITKVVRGRSGTSLVSFNDHAHFEGVHRDLLTYR
ncbi:histidine phosphatase family protein [Actinocrispum wychmicini]|uniref:Broad specificity phosphatase PhoE n=1 Tax=Actinocrispum wychmicini TaxID=1213861 RepID=A0A4R2IIJ9_9PSEU|nr:histidine phosphatase family protein [Actinocrispum wychmicini]TCO44734.1 broad specificity phosphatase PhoE [Actinocrispum wychmicini]